MLKTLLVFLLLFCSEIAFSDEFISLEKLVNLLNDGPISKVTETSERYVYEKNGKSHIRVSNPVSKMGSGDKLEGVWRFQKLKNSKGVRIYLSLDHHYLDPIPKFEDHLVESCSGNMAITGENYINLSSGNTLIHSWSCGSLGCTVAFTFTELEEVCK